jgi:very-short-patch-repair endonuclease
VVSPLITEDGSERQLPDDDAPPIDWLLFRQHSVLSRRQALAEVGRGVLQNRLAQGRWRLVSRGVIVAHNGPLTKQQRLWIAVLRAGDHALCAGATAATLHGVRGYEPKEIQLLVPAERQVDPVAGARLHRTAVLPPQHVLDQASPPRTTIARAIVDAAAWAPTDDDARAIVAAAFQQGKVLASELEDVLKILPRHRRRALVEETALLAAQGAHAISELLLIKICHRHRLPLPEQQVRRTGAAGKVRYLDAYWPQWRLHVEVDGAWHLEVRSWWADMRRQNEVWTQGDRVLRFPAWVLMHRPAEVAAQLEAALTAAGWRR